MIIRDAQPSNKAWRDLLHDDTARKKNYPTMPLGLVTFHHFYSKQKLVALRALAKTYALQGVFKRGRPGMLLISGPDEASVGSCIAAVKVRRLSNAAGS